MEVQNDWNNNEIKEQDTTTQMDVEDTNNAEQTITYDDDDDDDDDDDEEDDDDVLDLDAMGGEAVCTQEAGALLMKFCPHDSSMLYPKEDKATRTLHYACRRCNFSIEQPPNQSMIYRNILKREVKNVLHTVPSTVRDDPTLTRSKDGSNACEVCGYTEAVFFHSDTGQSDSLALIFVCCNPQCDHKWVR